MLPACRLHWRRLMRPHIPRRLPLTHGRRIPCMRGRPLYCRMSYMLVTVGHGLSIAVHVLLLLLLLLMLLLPCLRGCSGDTRSNRRSDNPIDRFRLICNRKGGCNSDSRGGRVGNAAQRHGCCTARREELIVKGSIVIAATLVLLVGSPSDTGFSIVWYAIVKRPISAVHDDISGNGNGG
jgi:hypothetical protein